MRPNERIFNLVKGSPSWNSIRNQTDDSITEIYLYDEISYWGITAADFVEVLQSVSTDSIDLHINSPGGDVFEGLAILNTLRQFDGIVNVIVDGLAGSAASFIAMVGKSVTMSKNSMMVIHDAIGACIGNAAEMQAFTDLLEKTSINVSSIYAGKAGGSAEDWRAAMIAESWYTADEAVKVGLADNVSSFNDSNVDNVWDLSSFNKSAPSTGGGVVKQEPVAAKTNSNVVDFQLGSYLRTTLEELANA